jgi:hypothetical protein
MGSSSYSHENSLPFEPEGREYHLEKRKSEKDQVKNNRNKGETLLDARYDLLKAPDLPERLDQAGADSCHCAPQQRCI